MSKPFNLADAKLGHPVQTDTHHVKLVAFDFQIKAVTGDAVIGIADPKEGGFPSVGTWLPDGRACRGERSYAGLLVMAPLGVVNGRDVYPGDMLHFNGAAETCPVPFGVPFEPSAWAWPKPPRSYPLTEMTSAQANAAACSVPGVTCSTLAVAAASIRHGIDNGYLIDPTDIDHALGISQHGVDALASIKALVSERDELLKINGEQAKKLTRIYDIARHFYVLGNTEQDHVGAVSNARITDELRKAGL